MTGKIAQANSIEQAASIMNELLGSYTGRTDMY